MMIHSIHLPAHRRPASLVSLLLMTLLALVTFAYNPGLSTPPAAHAIAPTLNQRSLAFIPHQTQEAAATVYEVRGLDSTLTFAPQAITLSLPDARPLQIQFLSANPASVIDAGQALPGVINTYSGHEATHTQVSTYSDIAYRHLYTGIDLRYDGLAGSLKSTYTVAAGADPAQIRWLYAGAQGVAVDENGALSITLSNNSHIMEQAPTAWQVIDGRQVPVAAHFAIAADGSVSFALGAYDATKPLIIDPTIIYEANINVGDFESGQAIAVDDGGNAFVLAYTTPTNNNLDVALFKLDPQGTLLYLTYLQGSAQDNGHSLALDSSGNVIVVGYTDSDDFPVVNALDPTKNGVQRDSFFAKLNGADGSIIFSSYFGGTRSDDAFDVALNAADEIYLTGYTEATDFPVTPNAVQPELNLSQCFCADAFVSKIAADGQSVLYGTYLGGSFRDWGIGLDVDGAGNIYFAGTTRSDDFPLQNPIQDYMAGGEYDAFVSRISADGNTLDYSTYLGGNDWENVGRLAVDDAGNAYLAGSTRSPDYPTTPGAYQETFVGGILACEVPFGADQNCYDVYVSKILPDGSALAYSTFIGGYDEDEARDIAINAAGEVFIGGYTSSDDFPPDGSTGFDIIVSKLSADGSDLLYTVNIFSVIANAGHGIAVDNAGDVYITGAQNLSEQTYVAKIADSPATVTAHIGDLDGYRRALDNNRWRAALAAFVHDQDETPISGATVYVTLTVPNTPTPYHTSCVTNAAGGCLIISSKLRPLVNSITFTIDDVIAPGYGYNPAANHDPDGDSNGTTITITQPTVGEPAGYFPG